MPKKSRKDQCKPKDECNPKKTCQPSPCDLAERKLLEARAKRRATLREEFLKLSTDPRRHASGEGGVVFDPAIQRYTALKISTYEHFKPTPKTVRYGLLFLALPAFLLAYALKTEKNTREHRYRTGQVAYKDRLFKFQ